MAKADGQIILGLNISATTANIQAELNSILNNTKTKQIVLKTAIEKAQTEKNIESLVTNLSKKTVKLGVDINTKDVQGILAQQQKVASTQASLNRQMQEYRNIAKEIGVTLNKDTWNSFNHAIKTENFTKAKEIIKSAKKQIDDYNNSIKKMNSDTSVSGSVSSIVEKFRSLNTVSDETKQKVSQLKAALTRFENADSEQKKLRAYESLKQRLAELANEYKNISSIERTAIGNIPKTLEGIANKSVELKLAVDSSGINGSGITGLSSNLDELRVKAETLQQKLANLDPTNANDVKRLQEEVLKLDNEFKKVEKDAKIFEDVNSIATFTASIEKAKQKVEEYGVKYSAIKSRPDLVQELENLKNAANNISTPSQLKQFNAEFSKFDTKVIQAGLHCKSFGDILKSAFSNFAQFFSASRIIYEVMQSIKDMVSAVKELDAAMIELRKVTDASETEFQAFFERSKKTAIDYGTTMKDIINSTADFSRLGFNFEESEELAKTASVYNMVGDIHNIDQATESIISTMKAFGVEAKDSMSIVDKFNEVGNRFAISSAGIGEAFLRSASSMEAANNTIDQSIALITAANEIVQNPEKVGNAFKTISMRIRGAETELEEAGLDTEGMAKSTAKLREEILALADVDIMLDENTFKSTYQIMDELSQKWADLTDIQRASITELVAGKHQGNVMSSLMTNFDKAREALEVSMDSAGSGMKEFEIQMDSIEAKSNQFKAAFEALSTSVVNSDLLKGLIDTGTTLLQVLDSLIEKLGGFGNTITIIGLAIATLNFKGTVSLFTSIFNTLKNGFGIVPKLVTMFGNLKAAWEIGQSAGGGFITTLKGASSALIGTSSAASIATASIMAIVAVIAIAVVAYQNYRRSVEEARKKTLEESNAVIDNANQLRSAYVTYMQYANRTSLTSSEEESFKSAIDQVTKSLGDKASALGDVTAGTQGYTEAMKNAAQEELKAALTSAKQAKKAAQDNLKDATNSVWTGSKITIDLSGRTAIPEFKNAYEEVEKLMKDFMDEGTNGKELEPIGWDKNKKDYDAIVDYYYKLLELQNKLADAGNMDNDIYEEANKITGDLKDTVEDYLKKKYEELSLTYQLNNGIPTTIEEFKKYRDYLNSELGKDFIFDDGNSQLSSIIDGYLNEVQQYADFVSKLDNIKIETSAVENALSNIKKAFSNTFDLDGSVGAFRQWEASTAEFNNWIDSLSDSDKEIVYNISLNSDTATWTLNNWKDELQDLKNNTDALDILKAKVEAINDVARGTINFDFSAESSGLEDIKSAIGESISGTGLTSSAMAKVQSRYSDLASYNISELFEKTANGIHLNVDALRDLESEYEDVNKAYLDTALDEQVERYNKLTEEISKCTDVQEKAKLISQQESLGKQIEETSILAAQYDGLTSAYQKWIDAQSGGEEGDMYDNISDGLKNIKELFDEGLVGTNEFRAAVQMMSNEDLSTAPIDKLISAYQNGYDAMKRYFTDGQSGCVAFLSDVSKLNSEWAKMNSDGSWEINFGIGNDQEIADKLGISVDAVQAVMRKLSDYGFEINLDSVFDDLDMLENKFVTANEKLKELGSTDVDFNLNTKDIDDVTQQIETAKDILDKFKGTDGKVNISLEGASEAQLLLTALIQKKQELCTPDVMRVDTSNAKTDVENVIKSLQDFQSKNNELEIATAIGLDTTDAQSKVDSAISAISESDPEILASLGIDATSAETLKSTISALTPEVMVKAGIDATLIENYQATEHNAEGTVKWDNDTTKVDDWIIQKHNTDGTIYWDNNLNKVKTHFTATGTINWSGNGKAQGTAFKDGNWGAKESGTALGGELGQELIVRNGKFFTIGDDGAEFFNYQKGDIIFNAEQTKQIFEKGKISNGNRRGRALVEGTAFSSGTGRFYQSGKPITTKYVAPTDSSSSPTSSSKKSTKKKDEETEFERQYKYHQHLLAMDRETVQDYLNWLVNAYKEAYKAGQIELDDFYKYEEEVYDKSKSLFDDLIKDSEHAIDIWENQGGNEQNIINEYKAMQQAVHEQAEYYRSLGLSEENDKIQELQKQWWDYEKSIRETNAKIYEDIVKNSENTITLNENWLNNAVAEGNYEKVKEYSGNIINEYKAMQQAVHEQAEYYRSLGYSDTSDEISKLSDLWWDYQDSIVEAGSSGFQLLVDNAHDALDEIQNVYDTLKNAAQEYGDNGFISPDTLQDILSMGVEYLAMLKNQNGQLEINEEQINKIIKAKTNQLGVETALNYVEQLRTALTNNNASALNNLLDATQNATNSTWDLVYAQLASLDLTDTQFNTAVQRVNTIRSLTDTAISGIGQVTNSIADGLDQTSDALKQILDYTIEVIKQETENKIDNLEEQIDKYKEIVNLQKESLAKTKEQSDYNKTVSEKLKDIAKIQNQINQLSLDDSREAQAEKKSLEEELSKLQTDLADTQNDYAYDQTVETLDKMSEAYEDEKNDEIEILRDNISSYQKLYDLAIQRIKDEGSSLKDTLISWNEEYGNSLTSEIITAWDNAKNALKEYQYEYEKAVKATDSAIKSSKKGENRIVSDSSYSGSNYVNQTANTIVAQMKANSSAWGATEDTDRRRQLEDANQKLGKRLVALGVNAVYNRGDGVWYIGTIGGKKLYDEYPKYHTGGIVGTGTLKDNEVMSILEKGEAVLDKPKKKSLYRILDKSVEFGDLIGKLTNVLTGGFHNSADKFRDIIDKDIDKTLSQMNSDNSMSCHIERIEVTAPIQVSEKLDRDTIRKHAQTIGEVSAQYIKEGFTKRGIKSTAKLF